MSIIIHGRNLDDARRTDASSICTLIADHLGIDREHVKEQSHFMRDFGLDWLGQLELVILIEEVSGVELPDDGYRSDPIGRRVGAVNEECGGEQVSRDTGYNSRRSAHPWIASARIEQSQINGGSLLAKPRAR